MKKLVSIIVTNNNGRAFLPDCLSSIQAQTHRNIEIILVDNHSKDDSVSYTKKHYPQVRIVRNSENKGYASGNNIGLRYAKGEYILILNNDVKLKKDLVEKLLSAFKKIPNLGAVQPMVKLMKEPERLDSCGSFWTDTGFNYHYGIYKKADNPLYNEKYPVYSLKGVCMLIPRKIIDRVMLFDDDYWCYFEETDFCHRLWIAGYECWYYPESYLYHHMSGTRLKKSEAYIQFHSFKNRLCSYLKNLEPVNLLKVLPVYLFFTVLSSAIYLLWFKNIHLFMSVYKSIWWNIVNMRKTLKKRKFIQSTLRKKSDKDIFSVVKRNPRFNYYYYLITGLRNYYD